MKAIIYEKYGPPDANPELWSLTGLLHDADYDKWPEEHPDRVVAWLKELGEEEMRHYRAPFPTPEDRQPTLNWPRQIPIDGEPREMGELVAGYAEWLGSTTELPKLFINAEPGSILVGRQRAFCRTWPNQQEVTVKGIHFIQEDSPVEIGQAVAEWMDAVVTGGAS